MRMTRKAFLRLSGLSLLASCGWRRRAAGAIGSAASTSASKSGKVRWGMVIDLQKCDTRKCSRECIHACNATHNIPQFAERAHEVKWIWTEPFATVFPFSASANLQTQAAELEVPLMCNHCDDPPCTRVCPTQATWKREDGIVMMDWHRCIGCRYCVAACPYGSRSFNWQDPRPAIASVNSDFPTRTKGVVEKCNFCEERLARNQQPACVETCPEKAFVFGNLADAESAPRQLLRSRFAIQRKAELGTGPSIYYLV